MWALRVLKERMIFMFSEGEKCQEMIAVSRDCLKFCTFFAISRVYMDVSVPMAVIQCVYTDGTHIVGFFYSFIMYVSLMFVFGSPLLYFILMAGGFSFPCWRRRNSFKISEEAGSKDWRKRTKAG